MRGIIARDAPFPVEVMGFRRILFPVLMPPEGVFAWRAHLGAAHAVRRYVLLTLLVGLASWFISPVWAEETALELAGGDTLFVEGEDFTYERRIEMIDGQPVFQEVAIWEGGVTARFGEIVLQTEHVEALFDGAEVSRLEAGPQVTVTGLGGRARFECADVAIDLPSAEDEAEAYEGVCRDVRGYYLADADDLGLEGTAQYEINFTADVVRLEPDVAVLERPCVSLGDLDKPELAVRSGSIRLAIGEHPVTGERKVLRAWAADLSIKLFGFPVDLIPFPVSRGFGGPSGPGWDYPLPRIGWEGDQKLRWDESIIYDFALQGVDEGPRIRFRLDAFPFDRSYPELIADVKSEGLILGARTGYRREEDPESKPVHTFARPEIWLRSVRSPLGDSDLGFRAGVFWGNIEDVTAGMDLDRWGWNAVLDHRGADIGEFHLSPQIRFNDYYYQSGEDYAVLEARMRLRYVDPPRWGATLSYRRSWEWGSTPFAFDLPDVMEEIGLREQTRISRRWGAGFDWAWDLHEDEFERQECHLTYVFDSFQVSVGWDFATDAARVRFALPGSLR